MGLGLQTVVMSKSPVAYVSATSPTLLRSFRANLNNLTHQTGPLHTLTRLNQCELKRPRTHVQCGLSNQSGATSLVQSDSQQVEILARSETWVAVNKPQGILVHKTKLYHAAPGERYLVDIVSEAIAEQNASPKKVFPVQRLDRPTSGVMLFALGSSENANRLQNTLQCNQACKEYWALAFGAVMPVHWINDHPLRDMTGKVRRQRDASTTFEQLLQLNESDVSVVRAHISTGRRHQIRRHLSNSRHPVVGDTSHGKGALNREAREKYGVSRCCLHSRRLTFLDPDTKTTVTFEAPVPQDLRDVLLSFPDFRLCDHEDVADLGGPVS